MENKTADLSIRASDLKKSMYILIELAQSLAKGEKIRATIESDSERIRVKVYDIL